MGEQKISRQNLYHDDSESEFESESDGIGYIAPKLEFEFVEVDTTTTPHQDDNNVAEESNDVNEEDQEFAFPLFASAKPTQEIDSKQPDGSEERGRSKTAQPVQKISLRDHSEERIDNERPQSYYFASFSSVERFQFEQAAVSANDIYAQYFIQPNDYKLMHLNEYNANIDKELQKEKAKKAKNRPGKKKRQSRIACRERRLERVAIAKKKEKERKLKEKQEKFGKFKKQGGRHLKRVFSKGGQGRSKSTGNGSPASGASGAKSKPKYRTE